MVLFPIMANLFILVFGNSSVYILFIRVYFGNMQFSSLESTLFHIDMNSCFCSAEQQANPLLRGRPIAVCAYLSPGACIISPSIEAKRMGVETGMRMRDGKALCPQLYCLMPDPEKYRFINRKFLQIYQEYTDRVTPLSIDEFAIQMDKSPALEMRKGRGMSTTQAMFDIGLEIKRKIREEFDWMRVSIGYGPNRFLAKMASNLRKPDGLNEISKHNIVDVLSRMELEDIKGIKNGYGGRLRAAGIRTTLQFLFSSPDKLKEAFKSVNGLYWWNMLHGYEDARDFDRKSFGNSHALYEPYLARDPRLEQVLMQLVLKMGFRLRKAGYSASGIHVSALFDDFSFWHKGKKLMGSITDSRKLYEEAILVLQQGPRKHIRTLSVSCHYLDKPQAVQLSLFENNERQHKVELALDKITNRWGHNTVTPATMLNLDRRVLDRVPFGAVKELEEFLFQEAISGEAL